MDTKMPSTAAAKISRGGGSTGALTGPSLHGETAARRQAITELLFFAAVGDLARCKRICQTWRLEPKDPNCCDYDRRTPLHLAAAEGCYSVAEWLLLECAAPVNAVDRFYRTPLEDAVRGDHGEMANLLMRHDGRVLDKEGHLVELADSRLSGNVRIFGDMDPEWEVDPRQLVFLEKVGEGEFGVVYKAKYLGTLVAVKVLKNKDSLALGDFRTELNVLQKVHHPHCVQFVGAVTKSAPYMIITEFMGCGSLADILRQREYPNLRRAVQLALDCARGIAYLHNLSPMSIIHRDLKPANLMMGGLYLETPAQHRTMIHELGCMKLADFGLSKSLKLGRCDDNPDSSASVETAGKALRDNGGNNGRAEEEVGRAGTPRPNGNSPEGSATDMPGLGLGGGGGGGGGPAPPPRQSHSYKLTGETGSYRYMAPEVFRHELYNHKVDQYAFAMICFQLFEGFVPFSALKPLQAARAAAVNGLRPQWGAVNRHGKAVPRELKDLVASCWDAAFDQRPEMTQVIAALEAAMAKLPNERPPPPAAGAPGSAAQPECCSVQ